MDSGDNIHQALMRAVLDEIGADDLLLKGGSALRFAYGLDRLSRDLDFDARRPLRDLDKKIKLVDTPGVQIVGVDVIKNTDTSTRYRIRYKSSSGVQSSLKIEVSYRDTFDEQNDISVIDGIRYASLPRLIDQKLKAAFDGNKPRTRARDLYDLKFLATTYPEAFKPESAKRLHEFTRDLSLLFARYKPAFVEDRFYVDDSGIEDIILALQAAAERIHASRSLTIQVTDESATFR